MNPGDEIFEIYGGELVGYEVVGEVQASDGETFIQIMDGNGNMLYCHPDEIDSGEQHGVEHLAKNTYEELH